MYPDTDSAPIPIHNHEIETKRHRLPVSVADRMAQLRNWKVPEDAFAYILRNNLIPLIETIVAESQHPPRFVATLFAHSLKHLEGNKKAPPDFTYEKVRELFRFTRQRNLGNEILKKMLPIVYQHPNMDLDSVLITVDFREQSAEEILEFLPILRRKFSDIRLDNNHEAEIRWIMGQMRKRAVGNVSLRELRARVAQEINHG
jgi:glutamyl-tRNA(Gln) amidotransferase subunit E